jgi:hypothetical protein
VVLRPRIALLLGFWNKKIKAVKREQRIRRSKKDQTSPFKYAVFGIYRKNACFSDLYLIFDFANSFWQKEINWR